MPRELDPFKSENWERLPPLPPEPAPSRSSHDDDHLPMPGRPPERGRFLDWGRAALLLAEGRPVAEVARQLACPPERIWRNLKRSRKFRDRVAQQHEQLRLEVAMRFRNLDHKTVWQVEQQIDYGRQKPDTRALMWLTETLGIGTVPSMAASVGDWYGQVANGGKPLR